MKKLIILLMALVPFLSLAQNPVASEQIATDCLNMSKALENQEVLLPSQTQQAQSSDLKDLTGELLITVMYDEIWITYTGDEEVKFTILWGNGDVLLNDEYVDGSIHWDAQNKRYIVNLYYFVNMPPYCVDRDLLVHVHADGYNDLSKEHHVFWGLAPSGPGISDIEEMSPFSAFITIGYSCTVHYSNVWEFYLNDNDSHGICPLTRLDEDYYEEVVAGQKTMGGEIYGVSSKTILVPAREYDISISRFTDNEPEDYYNYAFGNYLSEEGRIDYAEKESFVAIEFDSYHPYWGSYWNLGYQISIDGQLITEPNDGLEFLITSRVVDLLPYGNAFGGDCHIEAMATDGYNSLSVDTVLSYHPIETRLTPDALIIDVNSGKGGMTLFVDGEEVTLSTDGSGTPAHIYSLPRHSGQDYSITVQVGNMITREINGVDSVLYQGRCQETTIVVPAKGILATSISLDKNSATVTEGETLQLTATVRPTNATHKTVSWASSDETIATVSYDGLVTAVAPGTATITATTTDGTNLSAECAVTVNQNIILATSISFDMTSTELTKGDTMQLTATVLPNNATNKTVTWTTSNAAVANVNDDGLVTALSRGFATITATTTDGTNLSNSCVVKVKPLPSSNCFAMSDTSVQHGESIAIPIYLTNEDEIISFQTDVFLPEGFSLAVDEDDEYLVTPTGRLSDDHILMAQNMSSGAVRVLCYSPNGTPIMGNEGALFYLHIQAPGDAGGDYTINLRNSLLTVSDYDELSIPDAAAMLTVNTFIPGDVNDSHTLTVTDIVMTAQYIMERNPSPFILAAADMNDDYNVTVTDIMYIAYLINHPTLSAPHRMPALTSTSDRMSGKGITLMADETCTVSIALDNVMSYSAFQLDLMLPDGMTASSFALTDRAGSHALDVNAVSGDKMRVLCYSPAIAAIDGHDGALLTFEVTTTGTVEGKIAVDGIELVTTDCRTVLLDGFAIGVNNATSVNVIDGNKTVSRVDYYNLAGQRVERPDSGVTLVVTTYNDGTRTTTKVIK